MVCLQGFVVGGSFESGCSMIVCLMYFCGVRYADCLCVMCGFFF